MSTSEVNGNFYRLYSCYSYIAAVVFIGPCQKNFESSRRVLLGCCIRDFLPVCMMALLIL